MHGNLDKQESKDGLFLRKPHGSPSWGRSRGLRDVNSLSSFSLNSFPLSKPLPCSRTNPKNSSTPGFFWGSKQLERDGHMKHTLTQFIFPCDPGNVKNMYDLGECPPRLDIKQLQHCLSLKTEPEACVHRRASHVKMGKFSSATNATI